MDCDDHEDEVEKRVAEGDTTGLEGFVAEKKVSIRVPLGDRSEGFVI